MAKKPIYVSAGKKTFSFRRFNRGHSTLADLTREASQRGRRVHKKKLAAVKEVTRYVGRPGMKHLEKDPDWLNIVTTYRPKTEKHKDQNFFRRAAVGRRMRKFEDPAYRDMWYDDSVSKVLSEYGGGDRNAIARREQKTDRALARTEEQGWASQKGPVGGTIYVKEHTRNGRSVKAHYRKRRP